MTLSAGTNSDDDKKRDDETASGTSLTPAASGAGGIDPFLAAANAGPEGVVEPRSLRARMLDYSAHAAMIIGLIGFAWTVSDHVVRRQAVAQTEAPAKVAAIAKPVEPPAKVAVAKMPEPPKIDEVAELRRANRQMAVDIKALHASLETVRGALAKDRTPDEVRALSASVETVKNGLTSAKNETGAEIAQLSGRLDKLQHDPNSKIQQLVDRLGKMEHQTVDTRSTGSIPPAPVAKAVPTPKPVPTPPAKPNTLASADEAAPKPQVLAGWVVRDVYDGVAIIEGRRGPMEVVPGVSIPGAGVVKSIERHGAGWTVTTTKGLLAYAAPPREYRRAYSRDFYPSRRYDF